MGNDLQRLKPRCLFEIELRPLLEDQRFPKLREVLGLQRVGTEAGLSKQPNSIPIRPQIEN